jgi:hypothetical protein
LRDGVDQILFAAQVLMTQRMRNVFFHEDFPAAALCSEMEKFRVCAIHWDTEAQRQFLLAIGCVKRDKVRAIRIHYQRTDALD